MKGIISKLFIILTNAERCRLFIMAGLDLLLGLADVAFLAALLFIIRAYTGSGFVNGRLSYYFTAIHQQPVGLTGLFLLLFIIKNIVGIWILKKQHTYVFSVASRLSEKNINNYFKANYNAFVNVDSSLRVRHVSNVPIEFSSYILTNFQQVIAQGLLVIFTTAAILLYHPVLFILLLVLLSPPIVILGWFTRDKLKKVRIQIKQSSARVIQYLQEALAGYVEANIYGKISFFVQRYHQHQQELNHSIASQQAIQGSSARVIEIFALSGFFILIVINTAFGEKNTIDVLTIGIFMTAAYKIIPGVVKIMNSATQMRTFSFILDDLIDETFVDNELSLSPKVEPINNIRFDHLGFKFKDRNIISDLNFELVPGDIAGISGASGKGKTTVLNLLLGFLQQDNGQIFINNNKTDTVARKTCWPRISYVKQQSFFINDTILRNITLTEDGYDDLRLSYALQVSGMDALLNTYPEGINTALNEHGKNISGGQRQRLALARALYNDYDLLILDEPFSELDETAEEEILSRLKLNNKSRIVILITHNKASLRYCNKIILV